MGFEESEDIAAVILDIKEQLGVTQILVEHDMALVMGIADHVLVLDFGRVIAQGIPARPGDQPRKGKVEPDLEEALGPFPVEGEIVHDAADAVVRGDRAEQLVRRAAVVDGNRKVEVGRDREQLVEALRLQVFVRSADVFEIEPDLADHDNHLVPCQPPHRSQIWFRGLERMMAHAGPNFFVGV